MGVKAKMRRNFAARIIYPHTLCLAIYVSQNANEKFRHQMRWPLVLANLYTFALYGGEVSRPRLYAQANLKAVGCANISEAGKPRPHGGRRYALNVFLTCR